MARNETQGTENAGIGKLLLAPVVGGLYVVAMPFIGIAMLANAIAKNLLGHAERGAADLAATMTPGWQPGEAHLTGKRPGDKGEGEAAATDEKIEELAREVEEKRKA
jgi:hypothetical protein